MSHEGEEMFKIVTSPGSVWCLGPFEGLVFASLEEARWPFRMRLPMR